MAKCFRANNNKNGCKRYSISKTDGKISGINHAYKYGLGLYWESAQVALRRIPKEIAEVLCLHIFSVNDKEKLSILLQADLEKNTLMKNSKRR